ncbi:MAG: glycoside hydrolase family 76 protein [Chitinophagaceae bacterium]
MRYFRKAFASALALLILSCTAHAQLPGYTTRINYLYKGINTMLTDKKKGLYFETTDTLRKENPHSWLWPLCALLQAGNEMEANDPGKKYMPPVEKAIASYYSDHPQPPAYQDYVTEERISSRFYDDNQWIAISFLDAYNRNHQPNYLATAKLIYRFMISGLDTITGGGIYWKEGDKSTKNTCSNGPGILVALELYKITRQRGYLDTALALYHWTNKYLQSPEGIYYDNIKTATLSIAKTTYTYNTGTMLQSNVLLYEITKDPHYLVTAQRIAKAGKEHFFKNGRLPNEYWFNAVLLRGYEALYKIDKNAGWIDFFIADGNRVWENERDADNLPGKEKAKRLIDLAAMIEIYARLKRLTKQ